MPALLAANRMHATAGRRARIVAGYAALAAVVFAAGFVLAPSPEGVSGPRWQGPRSWLARPVSIGPFTLDVASEGAGSFTRERLVGHWTLMYFGYSRCPDVCHPAIEALARVAAGLTAGARGVRVERVFVTVDPERDTPTRLREYLSRSDAGILAVHGSERRVAELARRAGILYTRRTRDSRGGYLVDHPAAILLIDPQARVRAGFLPPHDAERIVEEIVEMEPAFADEAAR